MDMFGFILHIFIEILMRVSEINMFWYISRRFKWLYITTHVVYSFVSLLQYSLEMSRSFILQTVTRCKILSIN